MATLRKPKWDREWPQAVTSKLNTHTCSPYGLSPFPKESNRHIDHDHYYYDLDQKPNRHFTTSLTPLNCPTAPAANRHAVRKRLRVVGVKAILRQQPDSFRFGVQGEHVYRGLYRSGDSPAKRH